MKSLACPLIVHTVEPARHLPKVGLDDVVRGEGREIDDDSEHGEDQRDPKGEAAVGEEAEVVRVDAAVVGFG